MLTVLEVLRAATEYLEKKGVENPRLNAELLLAHVLDVNRMQLYLQFDRPLGEEERAPLRGLIRSRGEGVPLQHLLGTVEFFGREFLCDARALIPRPETEQLAGLLLDSFPADAGQVLDVGTGSGVLAITFALERPKWSVAASDLSSQALELAEDNAKRLGASVGFHQADLLPPNTGPFNLLVANLPYIPTSEIESLSREVRQDPRQALDGGSDGLDLIRRLANEAPPQMGSGATLALEIGAGQHEHVTAFLEQQNFRDIQVLPDYQGQLRFILARYG